MQTVKELAAALGVESWVIRNILRKIPSYAKTLETDHRGKKIFLTAAQVKIISNHENIELARARVAKRKEQVLLDAVDITEGWIDPIPECLKCGE